MAVVGIAGHPGLAALKKMPSIIKEGKGKVNGLDAVRIGVINLMPNKEQTEIQYLDLFTPASSLVDFVWIKQSSRPSRHVAAEHLNAYYQTYAEADRDGLDALIVTGAPVEHLPFESVQYWDELTEILEDSGRKNRPTLFICWAAQAALYHFHQVPKYDLDHKCFGIFNHHKLGQDSLLEGVPSLFCAPHSRHTANRLEDVVKVSALKPLLHSDEAGVFMIRDLERPFLYITGHMEYDTLALDREYQRDVQKGLDIQVPRAYYRDNNPNLGVENTWHPGSAMIANSWLNEIVLFNALKEATVYIQENHKSTADVVAKTDEKQVI